MGKNTKGKKTTKKTKTPKNDSKATTKDIVEFYNGTNIFTLPNGDRYIGEYCAHRSGLIWREGHGVYITANQQVYEGEWKNDKLIEEQDINITYNDKTTYQGPIVKHKCCGPGTLAFKNGIKISAKFEQNVPIGNVMMIDLSGNLWHGIISQYSVYFYPENTFFTNISPHLGKKNELLEQLQPIWQPTPPTPTPVSSQETVDSEKRKETFARNFKVDTNVDFENSAWYQNYNNYKSQKEDVLTKVKACKRLNPEEKEWYSNYLHARQRLSKRKERKYITEKVVDNSLLEKLFKSLAEPTKEYRVIYPTQNKEDVVDQPDQKSGPMENVQISNEKEEGKIEETNFELECNDFLEEEKDKDVTDFFEEGRDENVIEELNQIEIIEEEIVEKSRKSFNGDTESLFDYVSAVLNKPIKRKCKNKNI